MVPLTDTASGLADALPAIAAQQRIAVDTEAGLLVPVIRGVDTATLTQVAAQSQRLIAEARAGHDGVTAYRRLRGEHWRP